VSTRPPWRRPLDLVLAACFGWFAVTSFLASSLSIVGVPLSAHGSWPVRVVHAYATGVAPLFLHNPLYFRVQNVIDTCVFGPFYLVLVYALVRGRAWIRLPAFVYVGAISYGMVLLMSTELFGPHRPTNYPVYFALNLPYLVIPIVLAWRLRAPAPCGRTA
jgi:hypothetical protein